MSKVREHITVFEHESIRFDKGEKKISEEQFIALQKYYGEGVPFYNLKYNGVQFNEYVGVLQVGNTLIEVLPKADRKESNQKKWRKILIGMLKAVGAFDIKSNSESNLKIKPNTILDLYFEMFIREVDYLLHNGLIKQYRKKEGNVTALKGSLQFVKHIQQNLIHQERFYVRHSTYDVEHQFHIILYKAIRLLSQINTNARLQNRIGALVLHFPEMPDIKVSRSTFERLVFNRKNQSYKKSLEIAKLLLLQYHPDLSKGRNHVLALMFDMNKLWEQFVYVSLRKYKDDNSTITAQTTMPFWQPENGCGSKIRPDIVVNKGRPDCVVLDTKWKNLNDYNPSPDDLRQIYVYHEYFGARRVALVYPGPPEKGSKGVFYPNAFSERMDKECSVILLEVPGKAEGNKSLIKTWQEEIGDQFSEWMKNASIIQ